MKILKCSTKTDFKMVEILAKEIWEEHFTPIIGASQVAYMLDKFLTCDGMEKSTVEDGYEFYCLYDKDDLFGFISIHPEDEMMFLSKLYIRKDQRGNGYSREALQFIESYTKEKKRKGIWLTCNKYNNHTLDVYKHLGFEIFDEAVNDIGNGYVMDDYYLRKFL